MGLERVLHLVLEFLVVFIRALAAYLKPPFRDLAAKKVVDSETVWMEIRPRTSKHKA